MTTESSELPRWDVESIFPSLDSPAYASARRAWRASLDELRALFERHRIGAGAAPASTDAAGQALSEVIAALSSLEESTRRLSTYVSALVATDASDTAAAAERSRLSADAAGVASLQTRLNGWIAACGAEALARTSALAEEHASWLQPLCRALGARDERARGGSARRHRRCRASKRAPRSRASSARRSRAPCGASLGRSRSCAAWRPRTIRSCAATPTTPNSPPGRRSRPRWRPA